MKTKFDKQIKEVQKRTKFSQGKHNFDMLKLEYWIELLREQFQNAPESNISLMDEKYNLDKNKLIKAAKKQLENHKKGFLNYIDAK